MIESFINKSYLKLLRVTMSNVVKIDEKLLKKVKRIVNTEANRIRYSNVKQFINLAVLEKLEKEAIN